MASRPALICSLSPFTFNWMIQRIHWAMNHAHARPLMLLPRCRKCAAAAVHTHGRLQLAQGVRLGPSFAVLPITLSLISTGLVCYSPYLG